MIVFDASTLVGAALKADSTPAHAVEHAATTDRIALSLAVLAEIVDVFQRPKLSRMFPPGQLDNILGLLAGAATWFDPVEPVTTCRDAKDNKYLELALVASAATIVTSDNDLLVLHPWREIAIVRASDDLARTT